MIRWELRKNCTFCLRSSVLKSGSATQVRLEGVFVEGLVHVTALWNDYYHFDPTGHRLCGEMTGKIYRLADKVKVRVMRVNVEEKKIDLELV